MAWCPGGLIFFFEAFSHRILAIFLISKTVSAVVVVSISNCLFPFSNQSYWLVSSRSVVVGSGDAVGGKPENPKKCAYSFDGSLWINFVAIWELVNSEDHWREAGKMENVRSTNVNERWSITCYQIGCNWTGFGQLLRIIDIKVRNYYECSKYVVVQNILFQTSKL